MPGAAMSCGRDNGQIFQLSERQPRRIRKSSERDLDRASQSETLSAQHHDARMFGDYEFAPARKLPPNSEKNDVEQNECSVFPSLSTPGVTSPAQHSRDDSRQSSKRAP